MIIVNCILIVESIRSLVEGNPNETSELHIPAVVSVSVALATKISLFMYCWSLKAGSSQVQILWEDHRMPFLFICKAALKSSQGNDIPINGFAILTNTGGAKLRWWIDPMGAM